MAIWKRSKTPGEKITSVAAGQVQPARKGVHRMLPQPLEVQLLAIAAPESEVERCAVAPLIGVAPSTLRTWCRAYQEGGVSGLSRQASSIAVRRRWV